jgi:3-methyladenine DNA glycosylase/8-oxoguanine DNA glycosylase
MEMTLPARQPFSLGAVIRSHGWVQLLPFESDDEYIGLRMSLELNTGKVVLVEIDETPDGVRVKSWGDVSPQEAAEIEAVARWMLDVDLDMSSFYDHARAEPKLAGAEANGRGRILRCPTVFEDVVKTILTTNTTWGGTKRMVRGLVEKYGAILPDEPGKRAFPSPQRLAAADVESLRQECKLGYRAPYVLELARRQASGEIDLEAYKTEHLSTLELRKQLLALKGVGDYAAANLLMLLGHYDYIPIDSWALTMVSREWHNGEPITRKEVEAAFEAWGEWKGLAFWLWEWNS